MRGIFNLLYLAVVVYAWLIVGRAVLSWMRVKPGTTLFRANVWLVKLTEPYLVLFRGVVPTWRLRGVDIDWSSVVALVVLFILARILLIL